MNYALMVPSPEDIRDLALDIQARGMGWEEAWEGFAAALSQRLERALRSALDLAQRKVGDPDDLVQDTMVHYHRRAQAGRLLLGWDPNRGCPLDFLAGMAFKQTVRKAHQRRVEHRARQVEPEHGRVDAQTPAPRGRRPRRWPPHLPSDR